MHTLVKADNWYVGLHWTTTLGNKVAKFTDMC